MTADQLAVNSRALIAAAAKLEHAGYDGDSYRFIEGLVLNLLADGYRPVQKPPPLRGPGASRHAIDEALAEAAKAVTDAKHRRTGGEK